jgi:predicted nucleic acid-binding protein
MLYLDTSAFIKLYLREDGSEEVHRLVASQPDPLPVWYLTEVEFANAVRFKVFLAEMKSAVAEEIISLFLDRKGKGQYFAPALDPVILQELSLRMTLKTPRIGCRALDILHVAAARLCEADLFVTADKRQSALADAEGLATELLA